MAKVKKLTDAEIFKFNFIFWSIFLGSFLILMFEVSAIASIISFIIIVIMFLIIISSESCTTAS